MSSIDERLEEAIIDAKHRVYADLLEMAHEESGGKHILVQDVRKYFESDATSNQQGVMECPICAQSRINFDEFVRHLKTHQEEQEE